MESHLKSQKKALKSFCVFALFVSVNLTQRNTLETEFVFLYLNVLAVFSCISQSERALEFCL